MIKSAGVAAFLLVFLLPGGRAPAQDEAAKLKRDNDLLTRENAVLKKEIEQLKRENELLKKEAKAAPEPSGTDKGETGANLKAMLGKVEYELLQCVRDPKNQTQVTFTFGLKSENGSAHHIAPHQLSLTDGDGAAIDVKVVKGPPLNDGGGGFGGGPPQAVFNLPKGQVIKFQIIVEGLKEGVTSIGRAELTMPGGRAPRVTFTSVKVASKK